MVVVNFNSFLLKYAYDILTLLFISSFFNVLLILFIFSVIKSKSDLNDTSENSLYGLDKYLIKNRLLFPELNALKSS